MTGKLGAGWRSRGLAILFMAGVVGLLANLPASSQPQQPQVKGQAAKQKKAGGLRVPVGAPPKKVKAHGDPLAKAGADPVDPDAPDAIFQFEMGTLRDDFLAARYYRCPKEDATAAPVVLLVHDKGRQGKDFEEPIRDLKGKSLADTLQNEGYAVLILDLRGHGLNERPKKELTPRQWQDMTEDLQSAYMFLLDRHNRRELNLSKFAVVGLGVGANLVAHWVAEPDAATPVAPPNSEARPSDLAAVVLISPEAEAQGMNLAADLATFADRLPVLVQTGENDEPTANAARAVQKAVERNRLSKVVLVPDSSLKGERLLRVASKATDSVFKFLEGNAKLRRDEWDGRYNLEPVASRNAHVVARPKAADADKAKEKEKDKDAVNKDKAGAEKR
ncbi:MAG: alpha/beta hydrolase [Isosphaeraceae bacterium]